MHRIKRRLSHERWRTVAHLLNLASSAATSWITLVQSPSFGCRNSRALGYQGLSSRRSSQRQSAASDKTNHVGLFNAPARWPTDVHTEITRSMQETRAAVTEKS